jgi:hypothetical protein
MPQRSLASQARGFLILVAAIFLLSRAATTVNAGPTGATPWAIIRCKFSDHPEEPAFDSGIITSSAGEAGYWGSVSYGKISLDGSGTYGWFTLPITLAQAQANGRRDKLFPICKAAATGVNFDIYYGVIVVLNADFDSGAVGPGQVVLSPWTWASNNAVTWIAHEMGHGYGLDHSFDDAATSYSPGNDSRPGAYGDSWDIMSAMTFGNINPTFVGAYGASGPGLNAHNLDTLGWLPSGRVTTWDGTCQNFPLVALNHPEVSGYFTVKVPSHDPGGDPTKYYTVELRQKSGWDAGIQRDTFLIHQISGGLSYLIRAQGGAERLPGQTFHDTQNNVAITVLNLYSAFSAGSVNVGKDTVWVQFGYQGQNGTFDDPYGTVADGLAPLGYNGTLMLKTGSTRETPTFNKPMKIAAWGGPATLGVTH